MSPFIEFAVRQGVPSTTVTLILMLPIVVTIIAFFRQVVGIKAFGIYTPALVTFAFFAIGMNASNGFFGGESFVKGVKYGSTIFITTILVGTLSRYLLKRFRLLYLPRVAIMITLVSFSTLALLIIGGQNHRTGWASVSIFPILIMIALVEKFVATQIEKGFRAAIVLSLETLFISLVCFSVINWQVFVVFIQAHPFSVLWTIVVNIFLGKWTGLRLSEYLRFKEVIKNVENVGKK